MSNAIGFLEIMGRDASLRHATVVDIGLALEALRVAPEARSAILGNDPARLEALLGASPCIFCGLHREEEEEEDEEPAKEDEIRQHSDASAFVPAD